MKLHAECRLPRCWLLRIQPVTGDSVHAYAGADQAASKPRCASRQNNVRLTPAATSCAIALSNIRIRGHRRWDTIIRGGVASHHAGHIPAWKMVIEIDECRLAGRTLTATVAAGVIFRRALLSSPLLNTGGGWRQLSAPGQQGDRSSRPVVVTAWVLWWPLGLCQIPEDCRTLKARPDPLVSQFATYTTLLNLLDAMATRRKFAEMPNGFCPSRSARNSST